MALLQKPPVAARALGARPVLWCVAIFLLSATLANAGIVGYDSWQWNGFSRTLLAPTPSSSPVSSLSSTLLSSWSSDDTVGESSVVSALSTSGAIGSLSGVVYYDANFNGVRDSGDWAICDMVVSLSDASNDTVLIAVTDANGAYTFKSLPADDYTITLTTPTVSPGVTAEGILTDANGAYVYTGRGVAVGESIADVQLEDGYTGVAYDFGQYAYPTNVISKRMLLNSSPGVPNTPDAPKLPPVPEPGTLALLLTAGLAFVGFARRR